MNEMPILAEHLCLTAGGRPILNVRALQVARGEALAVLGRNGAGKTTLLRACLGLHRPAAGRLRVRGAVVWQLGWLERQRLRRLIGYVPQATAAGSDVPLTMREVVAMGPTSRAGLLGPLRRQDWRTVDGWLERMGLAGLANQRFGEASGGEQRKALLARAMAQQPEMLLLDEPTAWLDLGWREQIVRLMQELHEQMRMTIMLVCHELEVLPPCCRRVILLAHGTVAACGPPQEVLTDAAVSAFYGDRFRVSRAAGRHAAIPAGEACG
jgi:iron complex transport system ATP-binding protein